MVNPHTNNPKRRHIYIGEREFSGKKSYYPSLGVREFSDGLQWICDHLRNDSIDSSFGLTDFLSLRERDIKINERFILNIDLDAFANILQDMRVISFTGNAEQSEGWENRVNSMISLLSKIPIKPVHITICRSQGTPTYVPFRLVDLIQEKVISELNDFYTSSSLRRFFKGYSPLSIFRNFKL